jgi:hypothetical protein
MIIPNKFNGFHNGVRRCFGGGGGGGGGGDGGDAGGGGPNDVYTPAYTPTSTTNTNTGSTLNTGNTAVSTATTTPPYANMAVNTQQGYDTLAGMKGTPWFQSGNAYNELLNQGFTSDQIKSSASSMYGAPSDANWSGLVQDAGMRSPTGRPMAGSDQFYQPVYNTSYQNYARPSTQFDVSTYGTQPMNSPAFNSGMSRGNINNTIENFYKTNPMGRDADISSTLDFMRDSGVNREDFQSWAGKNNYGPQMSMPSMQAQAQQPFNPFSNTSGYGGGLPMTAGYGGFGSRVGGLSPYVTNQMQQPYNPFSFQQQSYQPQMQMQNPFSFQQQSYQPSYQPQMQTPFSFQQPSFQQPSYQPSYQQQYNPFQMQSPFSYQQPSYGGYDTYGDDFGGGFNMRTPVTQQPTQPVAPRSSGPSQAIVGRSSQMRGTPNVMRRAEGGITSLMDDVE